MMIAEDSSLARGAFDDVLAASSVGTWKVEKDEGSEPRMYADATMLKLIGIDDPTGMTPEEIHHAWADRVDPAHLDALEEGTRYMAEGHHAEIQYPWHHPDGRTIIVRCGGVRDRTYTKGLRITGIHQWVTTMKHVDRVAEEQQRRLAEYRTRVGVIKGVIKAGQWYYHLDADNRITVVRHNEDLCRLIDNEYEDGEDAWTKIIHPEDLPAALEAFRAAIADRSGNTPYDVIFRIRNRNGDYRWFRSAGRITRNTDGSGDFIGALIDINETVRRRDEAREIDREYDKLLHETIGATRWAYTISPAGEVTAARYGDRIVQYLGANTGPMDWLNNVHPEDREQVGASFMAAVRDPEGKTPYEVSFRIASGEGVWRWGKSSGRIVLREDGSRELIGLSMDITDTVEEQKKRLLGAVPISPTVLSKANIGLWAFELDEGQPPRMYHDETMLGLVGLDHPLPPEEAYHAWYDHVDPDCYQLVNDAVAKMVAGEHAEVQYPWHHPDGHTMIVRCGGVRNFSYTKGIRVEGTHQNVSEVLHYDEAEEKRRHELAVAKAASEAKTSFLFNMSHDIRTPMNAIKGFVDIAKKNLDDPRILQDCFSKIDSSGELLLSLINSILDMSRIESGKAKVEAIEADVLESFRGVEPTMKSLAIAKSVKLGFEYGEIADRYVYADCDRATRVFVNLVSNAIKYTKPGGWVKVRCEQVGARTSSSVQNMEGNSSIGTDGDVRSPVAYYRYTFEDNGIGMSEEFQKHLYENFSRERNSTTSGVQGTGLGLALCKSLVELMGGTIECRSKQSEGTTFTVELPLRVREADAMGARTSSSVQNMEGNSSTGTDGDVRSPGFAGKRILLVEDNELNREVATYLLMEQGFEVESAEDGSIAVRLVKEKGLEYYDYILMDIQMPIMGGYEATRAIRALEEGQRSKVKGQTEEIKNHCLTSDLQPLTSRIPIIALSANAFAEDKAASIAAGMDDHVAKPIKVRELMTALAKFVNDSRVAENDI